MSRAVPTDLPGRQPRSGSPGVALPRADPGNPGRKAREKDGRTGRAPAIVLRREEVAHGALEKGTGLKGFEPLADGLRVHRST
jgi:hypothetical protein